MRKIRSKKTLTKNQNGMQTTLFLTIASPRHYEYSYLSTVYVWLCVLVRIRVFSTFDFIASRNERRKVGIYQVYKTEFIGSHSKKFPYECFICRFYEWSHSYAHCEIIPIGNSIPCFLCRFRCPFPFRSVHFANNSEYCFLWSSIWDITRQMTKG